jgi:hypothetical protein
VLRFKLEVTATIRCGHQPLRHRQQQVALFRELEA